MHVFDCCRAVELLRPRLLLESAVVVDPEIGVLLLLLLLVRIELHRFVSSEGKIEAGGISATGIIVLLVIVI